MGPGAVLTHEPLPAGSQMAVALRIIAKHNGWSRLCDFHHSTVSALINRGLVETRKLRPDKPCIGYVLTRMGQAELARIGPRGLVEKTRK